jgi:thioredoxin 1
VLLGASGICTFIRIQKRNWVEAEEEEERERERARNCKEGMMMMSTHLSTTTAARIANFADHENGRRNVLQQQSRQPQVLVSSLRNKSSRMETRKKSLQQQQQRQLRRKCSGFETATTTTRIRVYGGTTTKCKGAPGISEKEFDEVVLESKIPVLVDFWASWCGPCKLVAPSMDKIDKKYSGQVKVVKVETTENSELVEKYKVYGLPTLILFIDGKEVPGSRHEGAISFAKVESLLMSFLPTLVPS